MPGGKANDEQNAESETGQSAATAREKDTRTRRRRRSLFSVVAGSIAVAVVIIIFVRAGTPSARLDPEGPTGLAGADVRIGGYPVGLAVDDPAGTVYIAADNDGLFMFGAGACRPSDAGECRVRPVAAGGQYARSVVADVSAHTVYVANGPQRTVSVFNAATCNAAAIRGCSDPAAVIYLRGAAQALALDPRTGTLYADVLGPQSPREPGNGSAARDLAVISSKACNASSRRGCGTIRTVLVGHGGSAAMAVDQATGTVYMDDESGLAVIDGKACAGNADGCGKVVSSVPIYGYVSGVTAAEPGRVYVTSADTGTVAVVNTHTCNAAAGAHCVSPALIRAGPGPASAVAGASGRTLYVSDFVANTVSMVSVGACDGAVGNGSCRARHAAFPVGRGPAAMAFDQVTRTLYVANLDSRTVSRVSTVGCEAVSQHGCPAQSTAGTVPVWQTPESCDPEVAAYQSGLPAGPFLRSSVRIARGRADGEAWSVRARRGVRAPEGIEEGGLVMGGRWYPLCSGPLNGAGDAANVELIDTQPHGTVYGYIQHPVRATPVLAGAEVPPRPTVVAFHGTTFFIEVLPRHACAYHSLKLHGRAPDWSGTTNIEFGACEPGLPVYVSQLDATWGPGADN